MKTFLYIIALFTVHLGISQSNIYLGGCCDDKGKPKNPGDATLNFYHVKKHSKTLAFELKIESITLGQEKLKIDLHFKGNINCDTPILKVNDSLGIKVIIGKTTENGLNKFMYKIDFYHMDKPNECWKSAMQFTSFFEIYNQTQSLDLFAIGIEGENDYFRIDSGWMKLN